MVLWFVANSRANAGKTRSLMIDRVVSLRGSALPMLGVIGLSLLLPISDIHATGFAPNVGQGADIVMKELRWPRWDHPGSVLHVDTRPGVFSAPAQDACGRASHGHRLPAAFRLERGNVRRTLLRNGAEPDLCHDGPQPQLVHRVRRRACNGRQRGSPPECGNILRRVRRPGEGHPLSVQPTWDFQEHGRGKELQACLQHPAPALTAYIPYASGRGR